jgi:hypothetical protein
MDKIVPVIKALIPLLFTLAGAIGIQINPELQPFLEENLVAIVLAIGALASVVPSLRAALKFGKDAK